MSISSETKFKISSMHYISMFSLYINLKSVILYPILIPMYISKARQVRNIRKLNVLLCLLGTDHIANSWVKVPLIKINRKIDDKCTFR